MHWSDRWGAAFLGASIVMATFGLRADGASPEAPAKMPGIRSLAFSPDGKLLAVSSGEPKEAGTLVVWRLEDGRPLFVHEQPFGIASVAFSPDGDTLAVGSFSNDALLLDAMTGEKIGSLEGHANHVRCVAFSADGKRLATASYDRTIKLWNVETSALLQTLTGHGDVIYSLAFVPGKNLLVSGSNDRTSRIWNLETGEPLRIFDQSQFIVRRVTVSADGRWMVESRWDGYVRIRDLETLKLRGRVRSGGGIECAELSPDNALLAVCSHDRQVRLYEVALRDANPNEQQQFEALIARWDDDDFAVREAASEELRSFGMLVEPRLTVALDSPAAEVRVRARVLRRRVRSPEPSRLLEGHPGDVEFVRFSPDGQLLASGDKKGYVKLWDVKTGKEAASFTSRP